MPYLAAGSSAGGPITTLENKGIISRFNTSHELVDEIKLSTRDIAQTAFTGCLGVSIITMPNETKVYALGRDISLLVLLCE